MDLIKNLKARLFASQLRKPGFLFGKKVGLQMNAGNAFLYDFTLNAMQLKDGESILEIGFGNGKFFKQIFSKANNLKISGIDYSAKMIKEANVLNKDSIQSGHLTLINGNSDAMPFSANQFDKVFCLNVIYFWDDPAAHLKEVYRILKPGGKFYAVIRSKEQMQYMPFTKYGFSMYNETEWLDLLNNSDFKNLSALPITEPAVKHKGNEYTLQSICFEAAK
jgi:ubiquinone/menaquinone biosynthesis C-methylase UbiE